MRIFILRHGQVRPKSFRHPGSDEVIEDAYVNGNPSFPLGDPSISELGFAQARLSGERLKELGFHGTIYSSPYRRTLQTAGEISKILGLPVYPKGWLREHMFASNTAFVGMKLEELRKEFPFIAEDAELEWPWWTSEVDEPVKMAARVAADMERERKSWANEDVLLIGHGASTFHCIHALKIPVPETVRGGNCALSMYDTETGESFACDQTHLPEEYLSNNSHNYFYCIPDEILHGSPCRIVHISDTLEAKMPFYREILCTIRPHIILHTGDSVDEMKVGHADCPDANKERYRKGLQTLARMYEECGAERVIVTLGNNDIKKWIQELIPKAEIVPHGAVVNLGGQTFALAHAAVEFTAPADNYCYGHTFRWEPFQPENGGKPYNGIRHATFFSPSDGYVRRIWIPR